MRAPTRTWGELRHAVLAVLEGAQVQSAVHGSPQCAVGLLPAGHLRPPTSPTLKRGQVGAACQRCAASQCTHILLICEE